MDVVTLFCSYFFITTTVILLILITYLVYWIQYSRTLPPGPWGLPIVGYFPFLLGELPFKTIAKLARSYGSVMSVQLGSRTVIFLNDYQSMKDGFADSNDCLLRPPPEMFENIFPKETKNVILAEGEKAAQHRRFIVSTPKELGVGKHSLEPKILDEIKHLLYAIKSLNGEPTDLLKLFVTSAANVISLLEYGRRFEYTDESLQRHMREMEIFSEQSGIVNFRFFLPWIQYVPILNFFTRGNKVKNATAALRQISRGHLQLRQSTYVAGDKNDYVDAYLTERAHQIEKTGSDGHLINFRFETENNISPSFDGDLGLVYKPKPHKIRAIAK